MSIESEAMRRYLLSEEQRQQPMSQNDQVIINQLRPDVPGFYVDQYQKAQDVFGEQMMLAEQAQNAIARQSNMYQAPRAPINPNVTVVEPTTMTATPDGKIVIY